MDTEAIQAIRDLLRATREALHNPGVRTLDFAPPVHSYDDVRDEFHRVRGEYNEWLDAIWDAKRRLHASGFEMPDTWLQADIVFPVALKRTTARGYWFELRHAEKADLEKLKAELRQALRRLELRHKPKAATCETAETAAMRPAFKRDHLFLEWYEDGTSKTHHSHAEIRDRWNSMAKCDREKKCPRAAGNVTRETVIEAIKKAKGETIDVG